MFSFIINKVKTWAVWLVGLLAIVLYAFLQGRKRGANGVKTEIKEQTNELNKMFRELDSRAPDLDDAFARLRKRSKGGK